MAADRFQVTGHGEAQVDTRLSKKEGNQKALQAAEDAARMDALTQAVFRVYGNREKLGAKADQVLQEAYKRSRGFIVDQEPLAQRIENGKATVEVTYTFDAKPLRDFLEEYLGLSLAQETEGHIKVIVLSYTVEGQDRDHSKPPVLREEVKDNRMNVQISGGVSDASLDASSMRMGSAQQGNAKMQASGSDSVKARASSESDTFSDTSTFYQRITIYADTTKKAAGQTNEVRAKLGEMLKSAGLTTRFLDLNLMDRVFENEDQLYETLLGSLRRNPAVSPEEYVAVALNRFTPGVKGGHRFTSQVVYRVLRIKDGEVLLPDKLVAGDSGEQSSDDLARTVATERAMLRADAVLPDELRKAVKTTQRGAKREAAQASTSYAVRVDGITSPAATVSLKQALRAAGMTVTPAFRGEAKSESITVGLNGKTGADAMAALEPFLDKFEVITMNDRETVLRAK